MENHLIKISARFPSIDVDGNGAICLKFPLLLRYDFASKKNGNFFVKGWFFILFDDESKPIRKFA